MQTGPSIQIVATLEPKAYTNQTYFWLFGVQAHSSSPELCSNAHHLDDLVTLWRTPAVDLLRTGQHRLALCWEQDQRILEALWARGQKLQRSGFHGKL